MVTPNYMKMCFKTGTGINNWYKNIKDLVGLSDFTVQEELRDLYRQMIRPLTKPPKDFELWITNWEQIIVEDQDREQSFTKDTAA